MRPDAMRWRGFGPAIVLAVCLSIGIPGRATAAGWTVQSAPSPSGHARLTGVSCTGPNACTAVGYAFDEGDGTRALAERWNGTRWKVQPTPQPTGGKYVFLEGVSCLRPRTCTAVGFYTNTDGGVDKALVERWDGTGWTIQPTPKPAGAKSRRLFGVSCTAGDACTAVGIYWKGTTWVALAERWDGTSWKVQPTPTSPGGQFGSLGAVSCTAANDCTAVGDYGVSTATYFTFAPLAEHWDGAHWTVQSVPTPDGVNPTYLNGVSCTATNACTAVGNYTTDGGKDRTLAERWDGAQWTVQPTPNRPRPEHNVLYGVSCAAANACTAVGSSVKDDADARVGGRSRVLAERWDGASWTIQATPEPSGARGSAFSAVSCSAPASCTAVGSLVERYAR